MNIPTQNGRSLFHRGAVLAIAASAALAFYALPHAQAPAKKALTIDDYTKWRSIAGQAMSPRRQVGRLHAAAHQTVAAARRSRSCTC